MATDSVTISGFNDLDKGLADLAEKLGGSRAHRELNRTFRTSAKKNFSNRIKAQTPVDTGQTKRSVKTVARRPNRRDQVRNPDAVVVVQSGYKEPKGLSKRERFEWYSKIGVIRFSRKRGNKGTVPASVDLEQILEDGIEPFIDDYREEIIKVINREL